MKNRLAALLMMLNSIALAETPMHQRTEQELIDLVRQDCGSCHGMTLKGGLGPPLLPKNLKDKPDEYLFTVIQHGMPSKAMPPWGDILTHNETQQIIVLLRNDMKKNNAP